MATDTLPGSGYRTLSLDRDGAVATLRLNRPDRLNAINTEMQEELLTAIAAVAADGTTRCLVVTGEGRAFCSGADVREWQDFPMDGPEAVRRRVTRMAEIPLALTRLDLPVIAGVNGVAAGIGFSLALACDIVIAADSARFIQAFAQLGLIPDGGSTWFLPRLVGIHRAKEMIFSMRPVMAEEAHHLGLINDVVPGSELSATVAALGAKLAAGPTLAHAAAKRLLNSAGDHDLETAAANEAVLQAMCFMSTDCTEGLSSFLEKRPPDFRGK